MSTSHSTVVEAMNLILASSSEEETEDVAKRNSLEIVKKYHKEKRLGPDENPLKWWKERSADSDYQILGKIAQQYLICPPSSAPSEQLFSGAGLIYDEKRKRLQGEKAEKLLFLKSNLPLIKFKYSVLSSYYKVHIIHTVTL